MQRGKNYALLVAVITIKPIKCRGWWQSTAYVPGRASNHSASNNDLDKQSTRLKLGERAFSVAGPRVWKQLPTDLKIITDTRVFRHKLRLDFFIFVSIYPYTY